MLQHTLLLFQTAEGLDREGEGVGTQSFFDIITQGGPLGIIIVLVLLVLSVMVTRSSFLSEQKVTSSVIYGLRPMVLVVDRLILQGFSVMMQVQLNFLCGLVDRR